MAVQTDQDMYFLMISNVKSDIQPDYYGSPDYPPVWRGFMEKTWGVRYQMKREGHVEEN